MMTQAFLRKADAPPGEERSIATLRATAVGTSIGAMAIGVSFAFLNVNIVVISMATGGMLAGRFLGTRFGRWAEIVGGLALSALEHRFFMLI